MKTWLLLAAYESSSSPCLTAPSPTPYEPSFSHNRRYSL